MVSQRKRPRLKKGVEADRRELEKGEDWRIINHRVKNGGVDFLCRRNETWEPSENVGLADAQVLDYARQHDWKAKPSLSWEAKFNAFIGSLTAASKSARICVGNGHAERHQQPHEKIDYRKADHQIQEEEEQRRDRLANDFTATLNVKRFEMVTWEEEAMAHVCKGAVFLHHIWQNSAAILQKEATAFKLTRILRENLGFAERYKNEDDVVTVCTIAYCIIEEDTIKANEPIIDLWPKFGAFIVSLRDAWAYDNDLRLAFAGQMERSSPSFKAVMERCGTLTKMPRISV